MPFQSFTTIFHVTPCVSLFFYFFRMTPLESRFFSQAPHLIKNQRSPVAQYLRKFAHALYVIATVIHDFAHQILAFVFQIELISFRFCAF